MDKYEYNLKLDQIKALSAEEGYMSAAEIADSINWNKIKNVNTLVKIGEIYEKAERYQDARDILLMAYDRSPIGRMIIYRLAEVAIKMGDYDAATEYYDEFVEIAPHDDMKYVLRYAIKKGQGASFDELITILEEYKDEEYTEEWAYELAYLYHKAGKADKCIDACDELILWFGDGPYVERALELKMLYQPLTKAQEEKYRRFKAEKEKPAKIKDEAEVTEIGAMEMVKGGEIVHDDVTIPQITVNQEKFNTVNLQQEIAKGMQQIMEAKGKNEVADTMDTIKKIVEDIPYLKLEKEQEEYVQQPEETEHIATDEEIDGSLKLNFKELLGEDADGQMSMVMSEKTQLEHQITGQMSIQDVLEEWEKTRHAAEIALKEAEQQKLESAKARALQEAGDIMERLNDVIPKLDAGVTPKELLEEEYLKVPVDIIEQKAAVKESEEEQKPDMQELYAEETVDEVQEPQEAPEDTIDEAQEPQEAPKEAIDEAQESQEAPEEAIDEAQEPQEAPEEAADEVKEPVGEPEDIIMAEESEKDEILMQPTTMMPEITDDMLNVDDDTSDDETSQEKENVSEKRDFDHVTSFIEQEIAKMTAKNPGLEKKLDMAKTRKMPDISLPEDLDSEEDDSKLKETKHIKELTSEQKAIFSYFIPVKGMEDQICKAYNAVLDHFNRKENASTGNLIIQGEQGCGKTMLATSFIKVLQKDGEQLTGKMGKIDAAALNKKDVQQVVRKITGGCLIIERAGDIDRSIAAQLSFLMEHDITGTLYILEDTSKGIKKALSMDEGFASKFTEKISVPIFTNDELVLFAKSYSAELGYKIDEMAILALHNRISNIERIDQATTLTEVKDIIDEAIDREAHSGLKKAISILTARRYTDDDRIVLKEDHFREK
ncbi:tetratricopeptide repeat protein [Agathobacter rectalis]|uniref:tetratricopeptide repeat protein n=1 Tax=Agathobacter rectalis TaxID=39491 RepID=UPI0027D33B3A|nr:tetratricopeptide repeat protein [Agathobacter rectalis]MDB8010274.1 tetratricopeptide repeat protein [Agathobacter rectalis]MDB8012913.1 tetratricopeptide repeat protein [Agathobacter rectalis]